MDKKYVFPKVELKKQPRTNYDLSHSIRTTFAPCLSIPIMDIETVPTDSFILKMQSLIESLPMVAPSMGRWKASFKFFINPMSNYYGWMDNNERLSTSEWLDRDCHCFCLPLPTELRGIPEDFSDEDIASYKVGVASSSLFNYLGIPAGFIGNNWTSAGDEYGDFYRRSNSSDAFNAEGLLTYFDIVRNYLVNNQETRFPMVCAFSNYTDEGLVEPVIKWYDVDTLDYLFKTLRMCNQGVSNLFDVSTWDLDLTDALLRSKLGEFLTDLSYSYAVPFGGLVCTPALMDFNRGIMSKNVGSLEAKVVIDESDSAYSFGVPQLQFKNKMQNLINLIDLSGGRFGDFMSTVWQSNLKGGVDKPIFIGSRSEWIYMTDIISLATTGSSSDKNSSTLGQQGGFVAGRTRNDKRAVCNFNFNEYGRFMCIFQLVPDVDYCEGLDLKLFKRTFSDKYIPQYSQIGYQDVSNHELMALPAGSYAPSREDIIYPRLDVNGAPKAVGKRIAWSEYMCQLDKVYGLFSTNQSFSYWALLRKYRLPVRDWIDESMSDNYYNVDFSTYLMPFDYNNLFVDQKYDSQNFRLQVYFDIKAKRPFPKRSLPRL